MHGLPSRLLRHLDIAKSSPLRPTPASHTVQRGGVMLAASMVLLAVMHGDLDATAPRWNPDRLAVAHSHNDYEQRTPLFDALRAGFASVEADGCAP